MSTILCVDVEPAVAAVLEHVLHDLGHESILATTVEDALDSLSRQRVDLIIADCMLPGRERFDLLDALREQGLEIPVIIMSSYSSVEHAVAAMRRGAMDYLTKPLRAESVRIAVNNALEVDRLRRENAEVRREISALRGTRAIIGDSVALREILGAIEAVAPTRAAVLLQGESGTGKELFAREIHARSPRHDQPFVTVNCAALPEGLVESAMFGHERGAFTGATGRMPGAFERANRGTILLDEISEMRIDLQSKLLRVLQEQEIERVGGIQPIKVDVRVIATTNRDLQIEVEAGRFRQDLFYRLNVIAIHTPPLRDRLEDIPALVHHFVERASLELAIKPPAVPQETIEHLMRRPWPGNIRELGNAVERAMILRSGSVLTPESFGRPPVGSPRTLAEAMIQRPTSVPLVPAGIAEEGVIPRAKYGSDGIERAEEVLDLQKLEMIAIRKALAKTGGQKTKAAQLLGINERTLRNKLKAERESA
jgi:DNA-binding NtrC family response regulator